MTIAKDNLTWISSAFPQYNDLLDLQIHHRDHVLIEYSLSSSFDAKNWTYKSDMDPLLDMESIHGSGKRSANHTGFYFCANDVIMDKNLKYGTFQQANEKCKDILTPKICNNQTLKRELIELSTISEVISTVSTFNLGTRKVFNNSMLLLDTV